jgi:MSHA biogenesis protein MshK
MVDCLTSNRCFCYVALALALLASMAGVQAQTVMADPTAPPTGFDASSGDAPEAAGSLLQSVKIPKKGKPVAMIGGQEVKLGELYGDSRLVKLTEREAVLDGPSGIEHLMLTPGIEKINVTKKSPAAKSVQSGSKP